MSNPYENLPKIAKKWVDGLATGFFLGSLPKAPGTWGTLGAFPLILLNFLITYLLGAAFSWIFYLFCCVLGYVVISLYEKDHSSHDPPQIVLDEILGFTLIFLIIPPSFFSLSVGFIIFRLFDIFKPFPVSLVEQRFHNQALGTLLDDLTAGLLSLITLGLLQFILTLI